MSAPAGYWDYRTAPVLVDGRWLPATACGTCGKWLAPYKVAVPSAETGSYCWGHYPNESQPQETQ